MNKKVNKSISLDENTIEKIKKLAKRERRTFSGTILKILLDALEKEKL